MCALDLDTTQETWHACAFLKRPRAPTSKHLRQVTTDDLGLLGIAESLIICVCVCAMTGSSTGHLVGIPKGGVLALPLLLALALEAILRKRAFA